MPRKEKKHDDKYIRMRPFAAKEIRAIGRKLSEVASQFDALADEIDKLGVGELNIDGASKIDRAMPLIRSFIGHVKMSISKSES